ncbi:MAG: glyoxylate/hydroxypyruvate reductase A [Balneolaceae bacterium]|nr:glyoxylate/hydroxypyruvate reductase A [Balneolaceae bacterium]
MSLLLVAPERDMKSLKESLLEVDPNLDVDLWPAVPNKKRVQFAVTWNHPRHLLGDFPNLKAVSSLGAGADHLLGDPDLPESVSICRVVAPSLVRQMQEYVLAAVLNFQRHTLRYLRQKERSEWNVHPNIPAGELPVGVMGLGAIGGPVAEFLAQSGYPVLGWSRTPGELEGVRCLSGRESLEAFAEQTRVLVCLLPLTAETEGILDLELMRRLVRPACLVNVARGEHLVEEDLVYTLDKGWLAGAFLDVFGEEPLPEKHPFWNRERIMVTPHAASITPPDEAAAQIVENYKRVLSGMAPLHGVDREKGY